MAKVAFISPKSYPAFCNSEKDTYGGAEIALSLTGRQLAKDTEIDVLFLVGDYGQADKERIHNVVFHKCLDSGAGTLSNALSLFRVIRRVDADVYIQRTLDLSSGVIALYCRLLGKCFVYWVAHDSETDGGHPLYKRRIHRLFVNMLFRCTSLVVVQNGYETDQLAIRYPKARTALIKKGIELPERPRQTNQDTLRYDAIWVGRCDEWKRPEAFVRLAAEFPKLRFLMICPPALGKEEYHQQLLSNATKHRNIEILGRTKNSTVLELIKQSRIFCITSTQEGDWPMVVLEAASLGRAILSLELHYSGLVDEYEGAVTCSANFDEFSACFRKLVDDDSLRRRIGEGAVRYVRDTHDLGKQTTILADRIHELTR